MKQLNGHYVRTENGLKGVFYTTLKGDTYHISDVFLHKHQLDKLYVEDKMFIWTLDDIDKNINQYRVKYYDVKREEYSVENWYRNIPLKDVIHSLEEAKEKYRLFIIDEIKKLLCCMINPSIIKFSED